MKPIDPEYLENKITVSPGSPFHRLLAILSDTCYGDIMDFQIEELEKTADSLRWRNAKNEKLP